MCKEYILPTIKDMLTAQELTSYISSRLCHDLISPISALSNVLELAKEIGLDEDMSELLTLSTNSASYKLQFNRLAFGAYGDASSEVDINELETIINNHIVSDKLKISWLDCSNNLPKPKAKLLLNLLVIAKNCAHQEGQLVVGCGEELTIEIKAPRLDLPHNLIDLANEKLKKSEINAQNIHLYYTLLLARDAKYIIKIYDQTPNSVIIKIKS